MEIQYKFKTKSKNSTEIRSINVREEENLSREHPPTMFATPIDRTKAVEEARENERMFKIGIETSNQNWNSNALCNEYGRTTGHMQRVSPVWQLFADWCGFGRRISAFGVQYVRILRQRSRNTALPTDWWYVIYVLTVTTKKCHILGRRLCESRSLALWAGGWSSPKYWIDDRP